MPRKPRFFVPGYAAHLVQRGHNRSVTFFEQEDYELYLSLLVDAADRYGSNIHAYVLMTNHVHLLATPSERESLSRTMQCVGRYYVPYINRKYRRSGTLWEGRFKACPVEDTHYTLACYRYIEMNPVRAGMVRHPRDYLWSSFRTNAGESESALLTEHAAYAGLGDTPSLQAANYRKLFDIEMNGEELLEIRQCLQTGTPYGNERFRSEIESVLNLKVGQRQRGRPTNKGSEALFGKGF